MQQYNMTGVPSFYIEGEIIVGLNTVALMKYKDFKLFTCKKCEKKMRIPKDKGTIIVTCSNCNTKYKIKT